jgi:hypothetical protein
MIDRWNEHLRCPQCRRTGEVHLAQDQGDAMPIADRISDGFRVVQTEYGPIFQCGICNVLTDQQGRLFISG